MLRPNSRNPSLDALCPHGLKTGPKFRDHLYAWRRTAADRAERAARFEVSVGEVREIFEDSMQRHDAPRIHAELRSRGHHVSRKTFAKPTKLRGIHPPQRKRRMPMTTGGRH
jgi:hypothetical protein